MAIKLAESWSLVRPVRRTAAESWSVIAAKAFAAGAVLALVTISMIQTDNRRSYELTQALTSANIFDPDYVPPDRRSHLHPALDAATATAVEAQQAQQQPESSPDQQAAQGSPGQQLNEASEWNEGQAFGVLGEPFFGHEQPEDYGGVMMDHCKEESDSEKNWSIFASDTKCDVEDR